jgi:hypothetical protein
MDGSLNDEEKEERESDNSFVVSKVRQMYLRMHMYIAPMLSFRVVVVVVCRPRVPHVFLSDA